MNNVCLPWPGVDQDRCAAASQTELSAGAGDQPAVQDIRTANKSKDMSRQFIYILFLLLALLLPLVAEDCGGLGGHPAVDLLCLAHAHPANISF